MKRILIISILSLALGSSQALYKGKGDVRLSPRLLNYQGFLTDTLGNPINDTLDFLFRIYSAQSGGTAIWTEIQLDMIITKGIFSAALGSVASLPDSVFTKGVNRWLELRIGGQTMSPRTQITAAGYAFTATYSDTAEYARSAPTVDSCRISANSHKLQGKDTTALDLRYINEGQVAGGVLGGTYPNPSLVDNAVTTPKILDSAVTMGKINRAGAVAGQVIKWNGSAWQPDNDASLPDNDWTISGNNQYSAVSGNVGIGTSNPLVKLDVNGSICGGLNDTVKAVYGGVFSGYHNLAGNAADDTASVIAGGYNNVVTGKYAVIGGGLNNNANNNFSTIAGGDSNIITDQYGTIAGGYRNDAGYMATVGGGNGNNASGSGAFIGGGAGNTSNGARATVAGGESNLANTSQATIGGGINNQIFGTAATIAGGSFGVASGGFSSLGGGRQNSVMYDYACVAGGWGDTVAGYCGGVFSGYSNLAGDATDDTASVVAGGYNNTITSKYAVIGGGLNNTVTYRYATVVGGYADTATGQYSFIGGGQSNLATLDNAVVAGGYNNTASGGTSVICGGMNNVSSNATSFVGGGSENIASESRSVVSGGWANTASGWCSTVGGGYNNAALDYASVVAGGREDTARAAYGAVFSGRYNHGGDEFSDTAAVVCGGWNNSALGQFSFVGGGYVDSASGRLSTVAGGWNNTASNECAVCVGGYFNTTSGQEASLVGGWRNVASGTYSFIGGGGDNTASGYGSAISGGNSHSASAFYAAVGGGFGDSVKANYGFAANDYSKVLAGHDNSTAFNGQSTTASGQTRVGVISKVSGTFTIDHPLDPENKILNHYFVESPEMVLIYRGTARIGENGSATVHLPDYFAALNENPQIQLTGVKSNDVWVEEKVKGNEFTIGGKPGIEVYWTVTGARKDPSAEITKIIMPVEQVKEGGLVGRSLDDEFLVSTMAQLERMGQSAGFKFRHLSEQNRYEEMKKQIEGGKE